MVPVVPVAKRYFFQIGGPMLVSLPRFRGQKMASGKDVFSPAGDKGNATLPATTANQSKDEAKATEQQSVPQNGNEGQSGPDYASFCTRYWKGCLDCQDYMAGKLFFCRKWNREHLGADVVSWKTGTGNPLEEAQRAPELRIARTWCFYCPEWQNSGSCWWIGRCGVDGSRVGHRSECHL